MSPTASSNQARWQFAPVSWRQPRNSRLIRRVCMAVALCCAVLLVVKWLGAMLWSASAIDWLVRGTRNPAIVLEASLLAWICTFDRTWRLAALVRGQWSWARQSLLLLGCVNVWAAGNCLLNYPEHLIHNARNATLDAQSQLRAIRGNDSVPVEGLATQCRDRLPPDTRILYHGSYEGWVLAYEVYPRRVYMLPSDWAKLSAGWHVGRWLKALPQDPLDAYWHQQVAASDNEREEFIRAHGITHEVFYEAGDPARCRYEAIR